MHTDSIFGGYSIRWCRLGTFQRPGRRQRRPVGSASRREVGRTLFGTRWSGSRFCRRVTRRLGLAQIARLICHVAIPAFLSLLPERSASPFKYVHFTSSILTEMGRLAYIQLHITRSHPIIIVCLRGFALVWHSICYAFMMMCQKTRRRVIWCPMVSSGLTDLFCINVYSEI